MKSFEDYGIGNTPLVGVQGFCPEGKLFIKCESGNYAGSIKARTAYFILSDLSDRCGSIAGLTLIESTSGNLGIALANIGRDLSIRVLCAVDSTVDKEKLSKIEKAGGEVRMVEATQTLDCRAARIAYVKRQENEEGYIWPNQYANEAGMMAHQCTTGPEIWEATGGKVDIVVVAVGTGGTVCGVGRYLRSRNPHVCVVGVEPVGSTIFGGQGGPYLSSGAGLDGPSPLVQKYGSVIDMYAKVADNVAITACREFVSKEPFSIGITSAACALVARQLARQHPEKIVVAIAADSMENYSSTIAAIPATAIINSNYVVEIHSSPYRREQKA